MKESRQSELDFGALPEPGADGIARWQAQRREQQLALAKKLGLPIGQEVEVWLKGGFRLRGRLELHDEMLVPIEAKHEMRFAVQSTPFLAAEIESCIRC